MAELQRMAERIAQLAERLAILETGQMTTSIPSAYTGESCLISGSVLVAQHYSLVLEYLEVANGSQIEVAGGSLVLIG